MNEIDKDIIMGKIGACMAVIFPFMDFLNPAIQAAGGVGGLVLLWLSIKHKRLQIKQMKGDSE